MYVDEIDFDALTVEKLIDLVFTEMVYRKIQRLEKEAPAERDQTDGNQWTILESALRCWTTKFAR